MYVSKYMVLQLHKLGEGTLEPDHLRIVRNTNARPYFQVDARTDADQKRDIVATFMWHLQLFKVTALWSLVGPGDSMRLSSTVGAIVKNNRTGVR